MLRLILCVCRAASGICTKTSVNCINCMYLWYGQSIDAVYWSIKWNTFKTKQEVINHSDWLKRYAVMKCHFTTVPNSTIMCRSGVEDICSMTCGCRVVNCDAPNIHWNHMSLIMATNWISILILFSFFIKFDIFLIYVSIFWCRYLYSKKNPREIRILRFWESEA